LFTIKNIIGQENFEKKIKNFVAAFCNIIILITVFAEKSSVNGLIFNYNPFSGGFFSNIINSSSSLIAWTIIIICNITLIILVKIKFREWPML
jgi:hypothetical protein